MSRVLVYENDEVHEYEVVYDQEYMNIRLDEYRRNFSFLKKGNILVSGNCSKDDVRDMFIYFDDVASFGITNCHGADYFIVDFVGAINPSVYNILAGENGTFSLDDNKMSTLLSWHDAVVGCAASSQNSDSYKVKQVDEFFGMDEKENITANITDLLDDVSLEYVGIRELASPKDVAIAKNNNKFIEKFDISLSSPKMLKK